MHPYSLTQQKEVSAGVEPASRGSEPRVLTDILRNQYMKKPEFFFWRGPSLAIPVEQLYAACTAKIGLRARFRPVEALLSNFKGRL